MARKKNRRFGRKFTLPVSIVAPILAAGMESASVLMDGSDFKHKAEYLTWQYTGYSGANKSINWGRLLQTYAPMAVGIGVHKFIGPAINRRLASAKIPVIRV